MSKIAIVTGASSGIGAAAAIALAERGVHILLTYNSNHEGALRLVEELRRRGVKAAPLTLDLGRSASFPAFRDAVAELLRREWGVERFDYLVNNAGAAKAAHLEEASEALFDEMMRVNLKGPYFLTQALLPLLADGGAIVNVASNSAMPSGLEPGYSAYGCTKGGLIVLTQYMAKEFSRRGIRVNAVSPGPTRTRLGGDAFDKFPEVLPPLIARTALGRLGEADDVGDAIAALLSDDCRWITAQNVEVAGGYGL
jgi:NAD(P)-dependent dehydrogenase (short-subunit alcohol dehydrogenase family)